MMSQAILQADYNWHPLVHRIQYEETLYFLLLRLERPHHRPVADQIREVLAAADVRFACEYSVFGYWDALVRVWLNDGAYHRLVRKLNRKADSNVHKFETFEARELRYLWSGSDRDWLDDDHDILTALARRKKLIDDVANAPEELDAASRATLHKDGLIINRDAIATESDGVKFYIALERVGGNITPDGEPDVVLDAIKRCKLVTCSSLYTGTSEFAAYLVRCVAPTYKQVLDYSANLDIHLAGTNLRPMTLLVANTDARESDLVNHPKLLSHRAETTLALLGLDDQPLKFASLYPADWEALDQLLQGAHEIADDDELLRERLIDILRACINNDHDALARAAAFLNDAEWFIGKYIIYAWKDSLGEHWFNELERRFDKDFPRSAQELQKKEKSWTAGSFAHMARATATFSPKFDAQLTRQLMPDWETQIIRYSERRNEPGHGRFRDISHLDAFRDKSYISLLHEVMDAAAFCTRARLIVESQGVDNSNA